MARAQIKNEKTYSKLRSKGESKEKAARISNAMADGSGSKSGSGTKSKSGSRASKSGSTRKSTTSRSSASKSGSGGASAASKVARKGGKSASYDEWSKPDLVNRAREIGIKGRSTMTKAELVNALRNH